MLQPDKGLSHRKGALGAAHFNSSQAIAGAHLAEHTMNMVLHGLFGKTQFERDLLIGETAANHFHELLLSAR